MNTPRNIFARAVGFVSLFPEPFLLTENVVIYTDDIPL